MQYREMKRRAADAEALIAKMSSDPSVPESIRDLVIHAQGVLSDIQGEIQAEREATLATKKGHSPVAAGAAKLSFAMTPHGAAGSADDDANLIAGLEQTFDVKITEAGLTLPDGTKLTGMDDVQDEPAHDSWPLND